LVKCPVCLVSCGSGKDGFERLASHFDATALVSDQWHISWLNRNIGKERMNLSTLSKALQEYYDHDDIIEWIERRFIERFYDKSVHPFVLAMQHPTRGVLLGYVIEHRHFLRQWVRSCATIAARTEMDDVIKYEIENISVEFTGADGRPAHYELLLRMGESYGLKRSSILSYSPLPATREAILFWDRICREESWVSAMCSMHSLELIASRELRNKGAKMHYFNPALLEGNELTEEARAFLREGYEADVSHSTEALELVSKYSYVEEEDNILSCFLASINKFDYYLNARLERGMEFES
jgi:pyrroloquinoline-quinone synthase